MGFEVARALRAPLDVFLVRKLGVPWQVELGFGAIASGGVRVLNEDLVAALELQEAVIEEVTARETEEIARREEAYRGGRRSPQIEGKTVIVVDDGLATGSTMLAAVKALRALRPRRIVVAVPVGAQESVDALARGADEVVCVFVPAHMVAIGIWYEDFAQLTDAQVRSLLAQADAQVEVGTLDVTEMLPIVSGLAADLALPPAPRGLVLFAHGSGSSRLSPRNRKVARILNRARLATLLTDLLTAEEERRDAATGELRFDIDLLAERVLAVTDWIGARKELAQLPLAYFGASTGAAAALVAAARRPGLVRCVVSRGGRPDLAGESLATVNAPTLLIVGGADEVVLRLNEEACGRLTTVSRLEVIPGATHLFEESGALEQVAELAREWVLAHLSEDMTG